MRQEWLEIIRVASNLRAGNHAYERNQIIGHCARGGWEMVITLALHPPKKKKDDDHVLLSSWNTSSSCARVKVDPLFETGSESTIPLIRSRGIS